MKVGHTIIVLAALAGGLGCSSAFAWDQDPFAQYLQRTDTVTTTAGDAKETNAVTHTIDPWPGNVGNRRIPGNGQRMSGAVERYRDVNKLKEAPKPIDQIIDSTGTGGGGGGGGSGGGQ